MKQLSFKLSLLIFFIALLSGFYTGLSLVENLIRAFVIYLVFSVAILLVMLIHTQVQYNLLHNYARQEEAREGPPPAMENKMNNQ